MNRNEMIEGIMRQAGLSKANVGRFYAGLVELVRKELVRNKEFVLPGLGALRVRKRKARIGRNPRTGETIQIPAKKVVRFRAYSSLGELLNGPTKGPAAEAAQTGGEDSDTANLWPQSDAPQEQ
jgi:DNA-binding protein HU-beta